MKKLSLSAILAIGIIGAFPLTASAQDSDFYAWASNFRTQAFNAGVSAATINENFRDLEYIPDVIYKDRNQPEFKLGLEDYKRRIVTPQRIAAGREKIAENKSTLDAIEQKYGVPKSIIVALWGIETNFGKSTGGYHVLSALATLAYEGRRNEYFSKEFIATLLLADKHPYISQPVMGSWAGALGQCQFMPSTYLKFAVDGNNNGKVDLWNEKPDVLASAANYLSQSGWKAGAPYAETVTLAQNIEESQMGLNVTKTIAEWQKMGVRFTAANNLPTDMPASLIQPNGSDKKYLIFNNYRAVLTWNRSHNFALTVGELANKIAATQKSHQPSNS